MQAHHWLFLGIVLLLGYVAGARYPSIARSIGAA